MAVGKKGIIFTMMAIVMVTIVLFAIRPQMISHSERRIPVIESRVDVANSHLSYLENSYLQRILRYTAFRGMNAYVEFLRHQYNDDPTNFPRTTTKMNLQFFQVMANSSMNGTCLNCSHYQIYTMENHTLNDKLGEFKQVSKDFLNINISVIPRSLTLFQSDTTGPWEIGIILNSSIEMNTSIAQWNITEVNTTTTFSILGVEDWFGTRNTWAFSGAPSIDYIVPANVTHWNREALIGHINQHTFKYEPTAPNFIQRFIENYNQSACCGIEAAIQPDLAAYAFTNISFIDYCYYGRLCNGSNPLGFFSLYNVTGISTSAYQFKIEPYHYAKERYNLTYRNETYPDGILVPVER